MQQRVMFTTFLSFFHTDACYDIHVKNQASLSGSRLTLRVKPSHKIIELKQGIQHATGIGILDQRLMFDETGLMDGHTLSHYGIIEDDVLDMYFVVRGS